MSSAYNNIKHGLSGRVRVNNIRFVYKQNRKDTGRQN